MSEVVLNKVTTIERCIHRLHEVYEGNNYKKNLRVVEKSILRSTTPQNDYCQR